MILLVPQFHCRKQSVKLEEVCLLTVTSTHLWIASAGEPPTMTGALNVHGGSVLSNGPSSPCCRFQVAPQCSMINPLFSNKDWNSLQSLNDDVFQYLVQSWIPCDYHPVEPGYQPQGVWPCQLREDSGSWPKYQAKFVDVGYGTRGLDLGWDLGWVTTPQH